MPGSSSDDPLHSLPVAAALARLDSTAAGLNADEAARRLQQHGPNRLPEPHLRGMLAVALHQFVSPFIYLLLAAAILSALLGHLADAGFIAVVLLVNGGIGFWQEWRAEIRVRALKSLVRGRIPVWRDGALAARDIEQLVPGDIVQLESGLKVPADLRLIEDEGLEVDESLLTGESLPVVKQADLPVAATAALGDRTNMLFAGTLVRSGRGRAVVAFTGRQSEIGRLSLALQGVGNPPPLLRRMERFTRHIAVGVLVLIALIALLEILRGADLADIFLLAIALAVSAIPEGLPVAMTIALSISVHRMGLRQVVVRHLPAVEGLGACTLIATDKTGTLTVNRLSIETLWLPGNETHPGIRLLPQDSRVRDLVLAAARCSESHGMGVDHTGEEIGDAVDLAFLRLAVHFDYDAAMEAMDHRGRIAYEPERRYAADFHSDGETLVGYVKGAPETLMALCGAGDWEPARRAEAEAAIQALAADGYRVIAVAAGPVTEPAAESLDGLSLLGFAGLIDPLRPEARPAIQAARAAGIRVVMITGDHPVTAAAIARDLDLLDGPVANGPVADGTLVNGRQLAALQHDRAAFDAAVLRAGVFARIEPLQKLAIVESLQRQGHVVAVTGDGINDAPALKAADIGVAMGRGGTDVAREAADLILVDDNFASIVAGIEEGRAAYANLRKVILHCISTGAAEIMLMLLATLSGLPPPLTAAQLLWLNLVANGIQDVALAFERPEPDLLRRAPRAANSPIFDRPMIEQVLLSGATIGLLSFAVYVYMLQTLGYSLVVVQGLMLWLLVWFENVHILNCRSETRSLFRIPLAANWLLIAGVAATQLLQLAAAQLPAIGPLLRLESVELHHVIWLALPALLLTVVMEGYKLWRSSRAPARAASS
ncbi:MAG: HAD-IC family P-type ATPase [Ferrovibrio sp.]|uniref:cation-translocating P-type ATPase n=1 Tax=Ferrovibrio sp. TaxID=1917215 RepID=UPI00262A51F5|nr:HAD-IC family P-type ATPase [Ferrovibrio sp.]MCW0235455.1 HAD-IC family P-type ATPase [Ferrovibrio sp.]